MYTPCTGFGLPCGLCRLATRAKQHGLLEGAFCSLKAKSCKANNPWHPQNRVPDVVEEFSCMTKFRLLKIPEHGNIKYGWEQKIRRKDIYLRVRKKLILILRCQIMLVILCSWLSGWFFHHSQYDRLGILSQETFESSPHVCLFPSAITHSLRAYPTMALDTRVMEKWDYTVL